MRRSRDKVYGLLSLVDRGTDFPVDYELDPSQVFCLTWAYFGFHTEQTAASILMSALGLDPKQAYRSIVRNHETAAQLLELDNITLTECVMRPAVDGSSTLSKVASRVKRRLSHSEQKLFPTCTACNVCFLGLPHRVVNDEILLWCTTLGTSTRYHAVFDPSLDIQKPGEYQATGVIVDEPQYEPRGPRMMPFQSGEKLTARFIQHRASSVPIQYSWTIHISQKLLLSLILVTSGLNI